MNIDDVVKDMDARFRSGNNVPVERAHITREQWEIVRQKLGVWWPSYDPLDWEPGQL